MKTILSERHLTNTGLGWIWLGDSFVTHETLAHVLPHRAGRWLSPIQLRAQKTDVRFYVLGQHCPAETSITMKRFCTCSDQYNSHQPSNIWNVVVLKKISLTNLTAKQPHEARATVLGTQSQMAEITSRQAGRMSQTARGSCWVLSPGSPCSYRDLFSS